ncbi:MAG TPA: phospholipase D-like domain-containing protein [bacterium]|nr:phospholipase D-like domain-containing protein [bacterium]
MEKKIALAILIAALAAAAAHAKIVTWFGQDVSVRDKLRVIIGEAENDVVVAMDRFTDYNLADALIFAAQRGRRVRVIIDGDKRNLLTGKALGDHLKGGGVEVMYDRSQSNLYDRFLVLDERFVIVGSYPFIEDAPSSPMTDLVVIDDADLAKQYLEFFDFIWNLTK